MPDFFLPLSLTVSLSPLYRSLFSYIFISCIPLLIAHCMRPIYLLKKKESVLVFLSVCLSVSVSLYIYLSLHLFCFFTLFSAFNCFCLTVSLSLSLSLSSSQFCLSILPFYLICPERSCDCESVPVSFPFILPVLSIHPAILFNLSWEIMRLWLWVCPCLFPFPPRSSVCPSCHSI